MLKTLIKIKIQGFFQRQLKSSKGKFAGQGKMVLMGLLFAYVGIVFCGMFGMMFYSLVEPFHLLNLDWLYFGLMGIIVIMFCFLGSVFMTEHEMYEAKDNELLMSMPIKNRDILLSRVCVILLLNYVYELLIAGPAFFIYITFVGMNIAQIVIFVIVFLTLPLFVLALSCLIAWIIAHVIARIRLKNVLTVVLFMAFFGLYMVGINYIEEYLTYLVTNGQTIAQAVEKSLFPIYHMGIAVSNGNILSLLVYLICSLVPFGIVIYVVSHNFVRTATMKPKMRKIKYEAKPMKQKSTVKALVLRELKHFSSSAMIMMNAAMGIIFTILVAIAMIFYADTLQTIISIPQIKDYVTPILCLTALSVGSMNIITASSISLEGNRLWILKSLPIHYFDILKSKLYVHLILCIPANIIFSVVASIIMKVSLRDTILIIVVPNIFTLFIALFGLLMNLWKPKFDWINETVCVKQSMPVMITMFSAMGMAFVIAMIYMWLHNIIPVYTYIYVVLLIISASCIFFYYLLKTWGVKEFQKI